MNALSGYSAKTSIRWASFLLSSFCNFLLVYDFKMNFVWSNHLADGSRSTVRKKLSYAQGDSRKMLSISEVTVYISESFNKIVKMGSVWHRIDTV